MDYSELMPINEAATKAGVDPSTVRRAIKRLGLKVVKVHAKLWLIHKSAVETLKKEKRGRGRPPWKSTAKSRKK